MFRLNEVQLVYVKTLTLTIPSKYVQLDNFQDYENVVNLVYNTSIIVIKHICAETNMYVIMPKCRLLQKRNKIVFV